MKQGTVTIYTMAWGNYWETYGKEWTQRILNLKDKPARVLVVSNHKIDTEFDNLVIDDPKPTPAKFRNQAIKTCLTFDTEWIMASDIDDGPYENYISDLNSDYDIHAIALDHWNGGSWGGSSVYWQNINDPAAEMPVCTCSAVKSKVFEKINYRTDVFSEDWALWIDLRNADCTVFFDPTPRYKYNDAPQGWTQSWVSQGYDVAHKQIHDIKAYYRYQQRKSKIELLYKEILNRNADADGLQHYCESGYSLEEIANIFKTSDEYKKMIAVDNRGQ